MLDETRSSTRRQFARNGLQSLVAMALIEGLWSSRLFGAGVAPLLDQWFKEINEISKDVHDHKSKDVAFQKSLECSTSAWTCRHFWSHLTSTGLPQVWSSRTREPRAFPATSCGSRDYRKSPSLASRSSR